MTKNLIIYGAGNPAIVKLIAAINRVEKEWQILGFIVDKKYAPPPSFMGYPILGGREIIPSLKEENTYFINNICSSSHARRLTSNILDENQCPLATLIDPYVDTTFAEIGQGTIINDNTSISANVKIGKHCAIRSNAVINHDNIVLDYVIICAGSTLSGHVRVENEAYIGVSSIVRERLTIGKESCVGAGAVVVKNVRPKTTVVGIPAREYVKKLD